MKTQGMIFVKGGKTLLIIANKMNKVIIIGRLGADPIEHDGNILNIQNSVEKNNQGKI